MEAFQSDGPGQRACAILEHVSLAAQWTHTMQHWDCYKDWTTRLYREMRREYKRGKISCDPAVDWYPQEILLFQKVIIPLTEKLQAPDVLGAIGNELYKYATHNCNEWASTQQDFAVASSSQIVDSSDRI